MKAGTSSLNPYAASYIPLSKRDVAEENKNYKLIEKDFRSGNEAGWKGSHLDDQTRSEHQCALNAHGNETHHYAEGFVLKGLAADGFCGSSTQIANVITDKQYLDDDFDMDLAYLQVTFPGLSDESLSNVYMANKCDLEATLDMLNQLELCAGDTSETLPDSLDIGDVSESSGTAAVDDGSSLKLTKVTREAEGCSSDPSPTT